MATINAGTYFPGEVVTEMFNAVRGHSAIAKLSAQDPIPFTGTTEFVFSAAGEASLVGEGDAKPAGNASVTAKVINPVKFVYQQRVSDEFVRSADEVRLGYLRAFADGFARKISRAVDISAIHGIDPASRAAASFRSTNSFDGLVSNIVTYVAASVDDNIDAAIAMITDGEVNGIAMSPTASAALAAIKVNGVPQFPEYRFGQNPDAFYGMTSDVNSTLAVQGTGVATVDHVIVGDFQNAFKWGYAANIPLEVIEYGDPDGAGRDLKQYNEVCLRAEAYIGWGILDADAFAIVQA